jgi:hypothetical protein
MDDLGFVDADAMNGGLFFIRLGATARIHRTGPLRLGVVVVSAERRMGGCGRPVSAAGPDVTSTGDVGFRPKPCFVVLQ